MPAPLPADPPLPPEPPAPHAPPALLPSGCPNCGHPLADPRPRYCGDCGQETHVKAPTVGEFLQQFSGTYFATEGALWRTLKLLLARPGELTAQYLAGRRKHYVLPLRLFLSVTVLMLLTMRVVSHVDYAAIDDPEVTQALPERPRSVQLDLGFASAGLDDGRFYCNGLPAWLCRRIQLRLDVDTRTMVQQMQRVTERVASHAGGVMIVLLPAFALGLWLVFRNRGLHYTEHLVFALHLHAFWFIVAAVMMWGLEPVVWAGLLVIPVYGLLALRRVYGGRWWALLLRAGTLAAVHGALVVLAVGVTTLAALLL